MLPSNNALIFEIADLSGQLGIDDFDLVLKTVKLLLQVDVFVSQDFLLKGFLPNPSGLFPPFKDLGYKEEKSSTGYIF